MYSVSAPPGPIRRGGGGGGGYPSTNGSTHPRGAPLSTSPPNMPRDKPPAPNAVTDMFDHMKAEYEAIVHELNASKLAQLEMERKVQSQVVEMELIHQTLKTLEANHHRICQKHEEDTARLRRQVEASQSAPLDQLQTNNKRLRITHSGSGLPSAQPSGPLTPLIANAAAAGLPSVPPSSRRSISPDGQPQTQTTTSSPNRSALDLDVSRAPSTIHIANGVLGSRAVPPLGGVPTKAGPAPLPPVKKSSPDAKQGVVVTPSLSIEKGSRVSSRRGSSSSPSAPVAPTQSSASKNHRDHRHRSAAESSPSSSTDSDPPAEDQARVGSTCTSAPPATVTFTNVGIPDKQPAAESNSGVATESNESPGSNTDPKAPSTVKTSRLNWRCVYSSTGGGTRTPQDPKQQQQQERPAPGMHQSMHHDSAVCAIRLATDGATVATGSYKSAQVFDVETGERKFVVSASHVVKASDSSESTKTSTTAATSPSESDDDSAYVRALCFSPDGTKLVAGMPRNTVRVWDIASSEEGIAMVGHEAPVYSLDCFESIIVSGSGDRSVRLWDARSGQCEKVFGSESGVGGGGGPTDGVTSVALSPGGRLLAAGSLDKVVRIWDTETAQLLDRLDGHSDSVYSIAFSPDGKQLISGSFDRTIMLWDVGGQGRTTSRPRMVFQAHRDLVLSVAYTPDGRWFLSGSKDRSVVFWDPRSSRSVLTLTGHRNSVISVVSSPASPYFATASGDGLGVVWKYRCESF